MKLYYSTGSCSLVVRIILNELDLPATYEAVTLSTKKTETGQDFYAINPKGAVPALVMDNGEILTENTVILQYLADTHDRHDLLPALGSMKRYRVLEALNFIGSDLHKSCAPFFNPQMPAEIKTTLFKPMLEMKLALADKALGDKRYVVNETFTLADAYLFVILSWMPHLPIALSAYKNLSRFFDHMSTHPSVLLSLKQEQDSKR
jgi:glutathione S-transferase